MSFANLLTAPETHSAKGQAAAHPARPRVMLGSRERGAAWRSYAWALVASDATLLALAFVLAVLLRDRLDVLPLQPRFDPWRYGLVAATLVPCLLGVFGLRGAYARRHLLGGPEEYARVVSGCTYGTILVVAASFGSGPGPLASRGWLLLFWALSVVLACGGRFALRRAAYLLRRRGVFVRRVLIAGTGGQGQAIAQQLHGPQERGIQVLGFLDDHLAAGSPVMRAGGARVGPLGRGGNEDTLTVVGHPSEARTLAAEYQADLLIVVSAALTWESQQALARLGQSDPGLEVRMAPTHYDLSAADVQPAPLNYVPLLQVRPGRVTGLEAFLKRGLDASVALLLLTALAPALACVAVRARRRGVHTLAQRRQVLGKGGRPVHLRVLDPAVSDRLLLRGAPAFLDVLRGDVALVGPRPIPVERSAGDAASAHVLLEVRPGLTGPWRLAGADLAPGAQRFADVWWVRNWSLWQHLFVLFQSARAALASPRGGRRLERWDLAAPHRGTHRLAW